MQLLKITLFAILSSFVAADIDNNDIPSQCSALCGTVVQLSRNCDKSTDNIDDDNDRAYLACVCQANGANTAIPACEACVSTFDSDRNDNDVNDLVRSCSFSTTAFDSASIFPSLSGTPVVATTTNPLGNTAIVAQTGTTTTSPTLGAGNAGQTSVTPTDTGNAASGLRVEMGMAATLFLGALRVLGLA